MSECTERGATDEQTLLCTLHSPNLSLELKRHFVPCNRKDTKNTDRIHCCHSPPHEITHTHTHQHASPLRYFSTLSSTCLLHFFHSLLLPLREMLLLFSFLSFSLSLSLSARSFTSLALFQCCFRHHYISTTLHVMHHSLARAMSLLLLLPLKDALTSLCSVLLYLLASSTAQRSLKSFSSVCVY